MAIISTPRMYLRRPRQVADPTDLYAHRVRLLDGTELELESLRGRPTLIVNTASKCGYAPQYQGLQELHERFGSRGLQLLGTPSGDFAGQEYDDAGEIGSFYEKNYGVSFPLTEKMSVRADPHPLWSDLARQPGSGAAGVDLHEVPRRWRRPPGGAGRRRFRPTIPRSSAALEAALPPS